MSMRAVSAIPGVLVDPVGCLERAATRPEPWWIGLTLAAGSIAVGLATLPRQIAALARALPMTGTPVLDIQTQALRTGLLHLIMADRAVPSPSVLAAAILLVLAAEPVLMLARDRRPAIWAVVLLGLAPLLVERVGELAMTYLASGGTLDTAGDVIELPHRFVTGPRAFWTAADAPLWIEILDARANLVSLWCLALWSIGLGRLAAHRFEMWHLALPAACLAAGGMVTWALGPVVLPMLLR